MQSTWDRRARMFYVGLLSFAAAFNAHLAVIRASARLLPMGGVVHDPEWRVRVAQALTARLSELVVTARIDAEIRLASGEAGMAVASLVQRLGADLLVIGRGPAGFGRLLRPNAFSIISAVSVCGRQR